VLVIAGLETAGARAREAERLLEYGFRNFTNYTLFKAGAPVEQADVWLGNRSQVPLVPERDVMVSLSREGRGELEVKVVYEGPIPAPVPSGARVAALEITAPGLQTMSVPLVAADEVRSASLLGRVSSAIGYLIWGST